MASVTTSMVLCSNRFLRTLVITIGRSGSRRPKLFTALRLLCTSPFDTLQNANHSASQDRGKTTFTRFVHRLPPNPVLGFCWPDRWTQRASFPRGFQGMCRGFERIRELQPVRQRISSSVVWSLTGSGASWNRTAVGVADRGTQRNLPNSVGCAQRGVEATCDFRLLHADRRAQGIPGSCIRLTSCTPNGLGPTDCSCHHWSVSDNQGQYRPPTNDRPCERVPNRCRWRFSPLKAVRHAAFTN